MGVLHQRECQNNTTELLSITCCSLTAYAIVMSIVGAAAVGLVIWLWLTKPIEPVCSTGILHTCIREKILLLYR